MRGNKPILSCSSVFPGYFFVGFDIDVDDWRKINSVYGIRRLMMFGDYIPPVPQGFVEKMVEAAEDGLIHQKEKIMGVSVGEVVKIVSGPLEGKIGICRLAENHRVAILLSLLGRENVVYCTQNQVEPAAQIM